VAGPVGRAAGPAVVAGPPQEREELLLAEHGCPEDERPLDGAPPPKAGRKGVKGRRVRAAAVQLAIGGGVHPLTGGVCVMQRRAPPGLAQKPTAAAQDEPREPLPPRRAAPRRFAR